MLLNDTHAKTDIFYYNGLARGATNAIAPRRNSMLLLMMNAENIGEPPSRSRPCGLYKGPIALAGSRNKLLMFPPIV